MTHVYFNNHKIMQQGSSYIILKSKGGTILLWHKKGSLSDNHNFLKTFLNMDDLFTPRRIYEFQLKSNKVAVRRINRNAEPVLEMKYTHIKGYECDNCKDIIGEDDIHRVERSVYCEDCFNDLYVICSNCEEPVDINEIIEIQGDFYCDDCANRYHFECPSCRTWYNRDNGYDTPDGLYCGDCFCDNFGTCDDCGEAFYQDDLQWNDNDGVYYCEECSCRQTLNSYSYKPAPIFNKLKHEVKNKHNLYLGFELEIEHGNDIRDKAEELHNWIETNNEIISDKLYFKQDASLENGYEIVSHPMTLGYIHKYLGAKKLLGYLKDDEYTSFDNGRCGLHVHFNRSYLKNSDILKLKTFFNLNKKHIEKFAQRKNSRYAQFEDFTAEDLMLNRPMYNEERYVAINVTSKTVEIRAFKGTLDYERFLATLQFVDALVNFIKDYSAVCLFNGRSWVEFVKYVNRDGRYQKLYEYLCKKKMAYRVMFHKTFGIKKLNRKGVKR